MMLLARKKGLMMEEAAMSEIDFGMVLRKEASE